jgi:hypothetical protein
VVDREADRAVADFVEEETREDSVVDVGALTEIKTTEEAIVVEIEEDLEDIIVIEESRVSCYFGGLLWKSGKTGLEFC